MYSIYPTSRLARSLALHSFNPLSAGLYRLRDGSPLRPRSPRPLPSLLYFYSVSSTPRTRRRRSRRWIRVVSRDDTLGDYLQQGARSPAHPRELPSHRHGLRRSRLRRIGALLWQNEPVRFQLFVVPLKTHSKSQSETGSLHRTRSCIPRWSAIAPQRPAYRGHSPSINVNSPSTRRSHRPLDFRPLPNVLPLPNMLPDRSSPAIVHEQGFGSR